VWNAIFPDSARSWASSRDCARPYFDQTKGKMESGVKARPAHLSVWNTALAS
jgi:hypothetical protein